MSQNKVREDSQQALVEFWRSLEVKLSTVTNILSNPVDDVTEEEIEAWVLDSSIFMEGYARAVVNTRRLLEKEEWDS